MLGTPRYSFLFTLFVRICIRSPYPQFKSVVYMCLHLRFFFLLRLELSCANNLLIIFSGALVSGETQNTCVLTHKQLSPFLPETVCNTHIFPTLFVLSIDMQWGHLPCNRLILLVCQKFHGLHRCAGSCICRIIPRSGFKSRNLGLRGQGSFWEWPCQHISTLPNLLARLYLTVRKHVCHMPRQFWCVPNEVNEMSADSDDPSCRLDTYCRSLQEQGQQCGQTRDPNSAISPTAGWSFVLSGKSPLCPPRRRGGLHPLSNPWRRGHVIRNPPVSASDFSLVWIPFNVLLLDN